MVRTKTKIMDVKGCINILKDPAYVVPEYGPFFHELEAATGLEFTQLKSVFTLNLFALNGVEHQQQRKVIANYLRKNTLQSFRSSFSAIVAQEFGLLSGNEIDLYPCCEILSYRCVYAYLGVNEKYHTKYLECLDTLRRLVTFGNPKKVKDYVRAETALTTLSELLFNADGLHDSSLVFGMGTELPDKAELFAIVVVLLAGSGALASTLANMILQFGIQDNAGRQKILATDNYPLLIECLLFTCGGTKEVFRTLGNDTSTVFHLDIDAASQSFSAKHDTVDCANLSGWGNLAFGAGMHRCVGEKLARLILEVAVESLLNKWPNLSVLGYDRTAFFLGSERKDLWCRLHP
ncbi:hypothetical protein [Rheinheimera maricola]|uniref:Cytochrome P450 n=1 Tax=Rheinheimera maricola TaxID=2793282 RepID=A0ABS7X463_9GAMM|nr:hypothetical protein [Rheinheimera maricola]MBZ9610338.1 cytochrome P450 [Rheinheimera maricola]